MEKLVYKDHPRDQQSMVLIHRWSCYASAITWKVYPWGPGKCGLYRQVVFRASLAVITRPWYNINFRAVLNQQNCYLHVSAQDF